MNRDRKNKWARNRFRQRYRNDASFREKILARGREWKKRKIERVPEYLKLSKLRTKRGKLHDIIDRHMKFVGEKEKELMQIVKDIQALSLKCRGR